MDMIKRIALTILALLLALLVWLDIQPEWPKYILGLLLLLGIWIPDKK